jgi:hypothetical protein
MKQLWLEPPLAFTVERLRESEIAFPTPLLEA